MSRPLVRLASLDLIRGFVAVGRRMSITLAADTGAAVHLHVRAFEWGPWQNCEQVSGVARYIHRTPPSITPIRRRMRHCAKASRSVVSSCMS